METFFTSNGIHMLKCIPLNFIIQTLYHDNTGPLRYSINIGTFGEMYNCVFIPEENKLLISRITFEDADVLTFHADEFELASAIVYSFALGQFGREVLEDTIYLD